MINQAIILAGGLGTRLRSVVSAVPKCMAPVAGRPFLFYIINYLRSEGIEKFIFSLGYKHELIEQYLQEQFKTLRYQAVIENEPLGTGGATRLACLKAESEDVLVANGDTFFRISVNTLANFHREKRVACTLSLKPMNDFDRYGVVELYEDGTIKRFNEKQHYESGLINGGLYALNVDRFLQADLPERFSFENDYLGKACNQPGHTGVNPNKQLFSGIVQDNYFIDIGIPEDFQKAQEDFKSVPLDLRNITKDWTLFLDRDGVINQEKPGSYVFNREEFIFYEGVLEAFKIFGRTFGKILVVTNQRGIGKGLMTENELADVHEKLIETVRQQGTPIDHIYFCGSTDNTDPCRKPNPGMAIQAKKDFPGIDFSKSIIAGNNTGDMLFGRFAGMYTVFIKTTHPEQTVPHPDIDQVFDTLIDFANAL